MYAISIMVVSLVLAGLSIISLVKNFLINFNVSDNGWKTIMVALLAVICLLSVLIGYVEAYTIRHINVMEPSPGIEQEEIDQLKNQIYTKTVTSAITTIIGFIAYLLHMKLIENIRNNKLKQLESAAERRWTHKL